MANYKTKETKELLFQDILKILKKYKWSILFITLIFGIASSIYVYFKPAVYNSYAIIKVKPSVKTKSEDLINNTISTKKSEDITEEISLLKTFKINNHALDKINIKVQYYKDEAYKKVEMYGNSPIDIKDIKILNSKVINKKLTLIPHENGYSIQYINSFKEKIKHTLFNKEIFKFDDNRIFPYDKTIRTKYFKLKIEKKGEIKEPIHFIIHGKKRDIFEYLIKDRLNITQLEKDTSLIKISYEDTIPARAKLYVDALSNSFIEHSIHNKNQQNNKTLKFIVKELENIKRELKSSEEELEKYQVEKSILQPSAQAMVYSKKLSDVEVKLSENNLKQKLILNLINFVQHNHNLDAIAPSVSKLGDNNTLRLINSLQTLQLQEEELSIEYTNEYPKLLSIRKKIRSIREKIDFNLNNLRKNIIAENSHLKENKLRYENQLKTLPSQERRLVNIKRNYEVKSRMYEYLLKKKAENKIIQLATFSDYQMIDQAYSSNIPLKTKRSLIPILSIILGFIIGSILAFIRESSNNYIKNKDDIEDMTSLPLYGSIPYYKQSQNEIQVHKEAKSPFSESFRTLRTNLQFMSQKDKGTVILITSTIPGEGKSTTTANLATILEMAKYKTIVINFDLRKPSLHKFFDVSNEKGVSGFLSGRYSLDEIILPTEFANLDIIPSGPVPIDPSELILSKELPKLFEKLKESYEYIIIDTAPIGIVSDTKTLMQYTDLNLIIIREDYAKKEFILTLEDMIEKHQFKNVGLILNASKAKGGEYGYGYSYEYKN